ncbi:MAG: cyclodeaminase/cyclohydrolase family protein [Firmicutes bacterium]|nr:cyclodeaminase/cyclohydrolase family protein [Bacillota bacterium]
MKFCESSVAAFTEVLASKEAVPGGGGASALVGAIGVALGNMVGSLTVGKKKYADVEEEVKALMEQGEILRCKMLDLIEADAACFAPLAKAYGIPKDDPQREEIMENALKVACSVPMDIMRVSCDALDLIKEFAKKGSALAISDAGCGAACCKAALQAASLNVFINTKSMKDREFALSLEKEAQEMLDEYCHLADEIFDIVFQKVRN